jgi:hypothetical protein
MTPTAAESLALGNTYVETFSGSWTSNSAVSLTITLYDMSDSTTVATYTNSFSGLNAANFGGYYGLRDFVTSGTLAGYEGYTLTSAPEPAALSLFGISAISLLARRRRHVVSIKRGSNCHF